MIEGNVGELAAAITNEVRPSMVSVPSGVTVTVFVPRFLIVSGCVASPAARRLMTVTMRSVWGDGRLIRSTASVRTVRPLIRIVHPVMLGVKDGPRPVRFRSQGDDPCTSS